MPNIAKRLVTSVLDGSLPGDLSDAWNDYLARRRKLSPDPRTAPQTTTSELLQRFAGLLTEPRSYLEVGVWTGRTFQAVNVAKRTAVDPEPMFSRRSLPAGVAVFAGTSDEFFAGLDDATRFDLIFLDGLHTFQQTYRDLINSLKYLSLPGIILIDDVVPVDAVSALPDRALANKTLAENDEIWAERQRRGATRFIWHGDVFRVIQLLHDHHPELYLRTIVGSENEQTVIVRGDGAEGSRPVSQEVLEGYREVSFESVFAAGVPISFRPGNEDEVVEDIRRVLGGNPG